MKDRFVKVREARKELKRLKAEISDLSEFMCLPATPVLGGVGNRNSGLNSGLLGAFVKREEMEEEYGALLEWFLSEKEALDRVLTEKVGKKEADVMREYYLRGRAWKEVSEVLELSESWMFKLHKKALKTLKESL